jgi:hypothetical protein
VSDAAASAAGGGFGGDGEGEQEEEGDDEEQKEATLGDNDTDVFGRRKYGDPSYSIVWWMSRRGYILVGGTPVLYRPRKISSNRRFNSSHTDGAITA